MRDLDLTTLRLFIATCEAGNIAHAAERNHVVGSAVSKRIAQLEAQLGTRLLVRRRHGVEPTSAGETLLAHARTMLMSAQLIERDMADFSAGVRGQVRLLATVSVLSESLADDLAAFLHQPEHADIRVDIEERVSTAVVQGVRAGVASLGICWNAVDLQDLSWRSYRHDQLALAVPPEHPLARRSRVTFVESLDWEHVCLPLDSAVVKQLMRVASEHGRRMNFRMVVTHFEAAMRAVRARLAISVVPMEAVTASADSYGLRLLPLADGWAQRQFALCYRDEAALSPAARILMDYLTARR